LLLRSLIARRNRKPKESNPDANAQGKSEMTNGKGRMDSQRLCSRRGNEADEWPNFLEFRLITSAATRSKAILKHALSKGAQHLSIALHELSSENAVFDLAGGIAGPNKKSPKRVLRAL
jgi:hypothetical protein